MLIRRLILCACFLFPVSEAAPAPKKPAKPAKDEPSCPAGYEEKGGRCVEIPTESRTPTTTKQK